LWPRAIVLVGFVAMLANILVLGLIASVLVGVYIVLVGLPALLIDAAVAFAVPRARDRRRRYRGVSRWQGDWAVAAR
jgi:hypothetical protein